MGILTIAAGIVLACGALLVFAALPKLLLLILMLGGAAVALFGLLVAADGAPKTGFGLLMAGCVWNVGLAWLLDHLRLWPRL